MATLQGDLSRARTYLTDCVRELGALGEKRFLLYSVIGLIGVALSEHRPRHAACLLGIFEALQAATRTHLLPLIEQFVEDFQAQIQSVLTPADFAAALRKGESMPLAQAILYAVTLEVPEDKVQEQG